tara:strand:+ start:105 stop:1259 length:1155 start_codon:yes stop_codon:yes gene_type:complete
MVGWSHLGFGKRENDDVESMLTSVAVQALDDSGFEPRDVDAVYLGHFGGAFSQQGFTASLVFQAEDSFRFKPSTRVENACATGSAAVHQGLDFIESRRGNVVLVVGVEKMTDLKGAAVGEALLTASYLKEESDIEGGFAGVFGKITQAYYQRYGDKGEALAGIAAKNHKNGVANPYAQIRKDLGFAFCNTVSDKNPLVAGPLKRTDCSLVSDGAAAMVLADMETALSCGKAVAIRSRAQVNDFLPMSKRDVIKFEGCRKAWEIALRDSRLTLDDLSFVETHDCFTIAELLEYEAMGLADPGEGAKIVAEGITQKDGKLPVNPSGGLKAKGHPIGATGVSMHVLTAMQVRGDAGEMQVKNANIGGIFNMGGVAVANYVSILEAIR